MIVRRLFRNSKIKSSLFLAAALLFSFVYPDLVMLTAEGETTMPKFVMMRLEDIGPGGQYNSLEQVGKLRAVLDYMHAQRIPVHLAVIPRWINVEADGTRYERSLDDANDPLAAALARVLREAVERGASVGLHGYTHQVGDVRRPDGFQESAIGNEFNVEGELATDSAAFAESRVREGLRIMQAAGLSPRFWEAPHYHTTAEQDAVFRRYFGLLYQADIAVNRNAPEAQYRNERLGEKGGGLARGSEQMLGLGAVNVPTPFLYIPYNRDENLIVDKLGRSKSIASFFYHPFLEFKHLLPVIDTQGTPALRDGIPEFRYPEREKTVLQKLAAKLKARGYLFYSIHDYVPFTPATTMMLGAPGTGLIQLGDVDGNGAADLVRWEKDGTVSVTSAPFRKQRGDAESVPAAVGWASIPFSAGSAMALCDANGDRKSDLWVLRGSGKGTLERYRSSGSGFSLAKSWSVFGAFGDGVQELYVLPQKNGDTVVAGLAANRLTLQGVYVHGDKAKPMKPHKFGTNNEKHFTVSRDAGGLARPDAPALVLARRDTATLVAFSPDPVTLEWKVQKADLDVPAERGDIAFGDFNGDGREDILRYDTESQRYSVYLQQADGTHKLLSTFGPWGRVGGKLVTADLDGNGKCDLALFEQGEPYIDTALSFETQQSPVLREE